MPKSHRRSMEILPRKGRMGHVISLLEQYNGLTRAAIVQACADNDLHGGSIDRMILYAKKVNLLLPDAPTLLSELATIEAPAPPSLPSHNKIATIDHGVVASRDLVAQIEMSPSALVFLADPLARQLAVGWTYCKGDETTWMALSGIKPCFRVEAKELCIALRGSGICRDGGITDTLALRYITTMATEPFLKRGRHNDKSDE